EHGTGAHEQQCGHQRRLAADPIAQVAEEDPTERPGDEARGEGEERKDLANELALLWEEQLREDKGGRRAVEEEVIPLDGCAHGTGDHRFHQRPLLVSGACLSLLVFGHGVFDGPWDRYNRGRTGNDCTTTARKKSVSVVTPRRGVTTDTDFFLGGS